MENDLNILHQTYNPEGSQLRKAQLRMLEMMKFVDAVCKKNSIPYWLDKTSTDLSKLLKKKTTPIS